MQSSNNAVELVSPVSFFMVPVLFIIGLFSFVALLSLIQ